MRCQNVSELRANSRPTEDQIESVFMCGIKTIIRIGFRDELTASEA